MRTHATVVSCVEGICFGFVQCARFPMGAYHLARVRGDFEDEWSSWQAPFRCYGRSVCVGLRFFRATSGKCRHPLQATAQLHATSMRWFRRPRGVLRRWLRVLVEATLHTAGCKCDCCQGVPTFRTCDKGVAVWRSSLTYKLQVV